MARLRPDFTLPGDGAQRLRRMLAMLSMLMLVAGVCVPVATATAQPRGVDGLAFGRGLSSEQRITRRSHIRSLAAAAAYAAAHPRSARHPELPRLRTSFEKAASLTPSTSPSTNTRLATPLLVATPDVAEITSFDGITESEGGDWIPADPWVAANSSYVVQVVNDMVRVSSRSGTTLVSVPHEAFFNIPPGYFGADARIIWDATHGRWVGETIWLAGDFSLNGFILAVSDSSDPTQGWSLIIVSYALGQFPDYPSLASSNDKIVIAADLVDGSSNFYGADINTLTWSSILGGGGLVYNYCDPGAYQHPRAAQVLSSSSDVHIVMEAADGSGHQLYWREKGTGQCSDFTDLTDLTDSLGFDSLLVAGPTNDIPPPPRQVGSDTIGSTLHPALDERPTDAVWQNNHLYWVSTHPKSYDAGATWNDDVVVWSTTTMTTSGSPSGNVKIEVSPGDTIDAYMGGIGLTRNGTPIIVYSQSDASSPIALYANRIDAGGALGTPILLDTSEDAIGGERWGDYAGVAMDPTGTGTVWASHMLAAADNTWRTDIVRLVVDGETPTTPGTPRAAALVPSALTFAPKYKISWGAASDASTGTVTYRLEQNVDGGGFAFAATLTGTSTIRSLFVGSTYQYRVWAVDALGNAGSAATGPTITPSIAQSPTSKSGTWHTSSSSNYSNGSTWYASAAGASASYKATGLRSIAIVTTKGSSRGSFKVYIDGAYKGTISTYATKTAYRQVVYQYSWSTAGTHTIKIVVKGTAGHPRVDFDAVLLLK